MRADAMLDLTRFKAVSPLALLGSAPPPRPKGPVRFCFDDMPEQERPTLLRECFARVGVHYEFNPPRDAPFHVDLALSPFPGLLVGVGRLQALRRRGARELAAQMSDDAALLVNLRGTHRVEQRKQDIVLGEGEAAFTSCSDVSTIVHGGESEMLVLRLPKTGLASLVEGLDDGWARRIPRELPALRLLRSYLTLAWDDQAQAGPDVQRSLVTHVYDLLALMMGTGPDITAIAQERGLAAARLHAVKRDIACNLAESDLSVAALALRHRCTARSIQRLFEQEGTTFTEYLLAQRLARAHDALGNPRRAAEKISTVALDCGFGDVSYFNRAFRRRYGAAPSDVRAQAQNWPPTAGRRDN
jgi:AraC-like DNA-binding protein